MRNVKLLGIFAGAVQSDLRARQRHSSRGQAGGAASYLGATLLHGAAAVRVHLVPAAA